MGRKMVGVLKCALGQRNAFRTKKFKISQKDGSKIRHKKKTLESQ